MRDDLRDLLRGSGSPTEGRNRLRELLQARIRALDWEKVLADVRPFLEDAGELGIITRENALRLLSG